MLERVSLGSGQDAGERGVCSFLRFSVRNGHSSLPPAFHSAVRGKVVVWYFVSTNDQINDISLSCFCSLRTPPTSSVVLCTTALHRLDYFPTQNAKQNTKHKTNTYEQRNHKTATNRKPAKKNKNTQYKKK